MTSFSYTDSVALLAGALTAALAVPSLFVLSRTPPQRKALRVLIAVALLGLGGVHVARGVGAFAKPPAPESVRARVDLAFPDLGKRRAVGLPDLEEFQRISIECQAGRSCDELLKVGVPACAQEARYCNNVALLIHYIGSTGTVDLEAARRGFRRACDDANLQFACNSLTTLFEDPELGPGAASARKVLESACAHENVLACALMVPMLRRGIAGDQDLSRARALAARGCEANHGIGCEELGLLIYEAKGDLAEARAAFKRGCELDRELSCWNLLIMVERGEGGPKEPSRALAEKACELGHLEACNALGVPSKWIGHRSHPKAVLFAFERTKVGSDTRRIDGDGDAFAVVTVEKKRKLTVEVSTAAGEHAVGEFGRYAAVETVIHEGYLFVLVHETTERGKITSTKGYRYGLKNGVLTPAGSFEGPERVDWRTAVAK